MPLTTQEKIEKVNTIWTRMKEINDLAVKENRALSAEEQTNFNAADKEMEVINQEMEREKRISSLKPSAALINGGIVAPGSATAKPTDEAKEQRTKEVRAGFNKYILGDIGEREYRDLQRDISAAGGFLSPPTTFVQDLIKTADNQTFIRQWTKGFKVKTSNIKFPIRASRMTAPTWTPEVDASATASDSGLTFGIRMMQPHKSSKRILVSNTLLRQSEMAPEGIVMEEFAYLYATAFEAFYLTGNGVDQPLGIFTPSSVGLPTSQDIVCAGTLAVTVWFDGLNDLISNLKGQYENVGKFLLHRLVLGQIKKAKSTTGFYLWQPPQAGTPATILGKEYGLSEYAPSALTANAYVVAFADFMNLYRYVDSMEMEVVRLNELYQGTDQTGYIARMWGDGAPVLAEAGTRMQMPAS